MLVTFIRHSCFLVETERFYYLFDYEKGALPEMDVEKPIFVLSSHGHGDHYNPGVFPLLNGMGMQSVRAVLSDDIAPPVDVEVLSVAPLQEYALAEGLGLTTFRSTDLGVAFLLEEDGVLFYHAGDLNDWVWAGEPDAYNREMTENYRAQIRFLSEKLGCRTLDTAFVVLDPRQKSDYDRGMLYFLEHIPVEKVYPMHCWGQTEITEKFLKEHPQYQNQIQKRG